MSFDMADEEDGKDDSFLEMSHCGLKVTSQGFKLVCAPSVQDDVGVRVKA